ncbi:polypeptide N-acetylgalactosaminyltransferase 5-like isoform X2 [Contarinia nasturtii]|uniref:polypeptide N-acetylgalactosaminyltransferase 5-like isoform X2 n=1 Tax=Contarinia nasturtii TaxID=265458 RepID=UPI0012D44EA1|nr:polypeptide N-acetylgalactosaminyltransferase 5-like isoform X2 [Contarinia nasturtii]
MNNNYVKITLLKIKTIVWILFGVVCAVLLLKSFHHDQLIQHKIEKQHERRPIYYDDGLRTEWNFKILKHYDHSKLHKWSKVRTKRELGSQGENGSAFVLSDAQKPLMKQLWDKHNYNLLASQMISVRRSLPDLRFPECHPLVYPEKLPTTSIIIIFHNEDISTLLRTIWSIIDRSPRELLKEIILVDDFSSDKNLTHKIHGNFTHLSINIKIIHNARREGLIRSRLIGAKEAKGEVLTFFDSHIECTEGWLQPILSRIASDRSVVAVPVIDRISAYDMSYSPYSASLGINGFRWHLIFTNMSVPQRERIRTNFDRTAPLRTPTHIGCSFAVDREFFFEIGSYDSMMNIWGSENLEMALRVWQCGGSLEILPCSRVGHLFRISNYGFDGDATVIKARNNVRLVEVWMDDFKQLFYAANPKSKGVQPGNLTDRIALKSRFKCKSFRWYLEHVYPESNWLKDYVFFGEVVSVADKTCLDLYKAREKEQLALFGCHHSGANQFFAFEKNGQIITAEELCVGVSDDKISVILVECSQHPTQLWSYEKKNQWIIHIETGLCLKNEMSKAVLANCEKSDKDINWELNSTN